MITVKMTEEGESFVERMRVVDTMIKAGTPIYAALSCGLEDKDWMLVYVAIKRLANDVEHHPERCLI